MGNFNTKTEYANLSDVKLDNKLFEYNEKSGILTIDNKKIKIKVNQINGKGKIYHINGNISEGEYNNGLLNGNGKCVGENGSIYEGEFTKGGLNGNGKKVFKNGNTYEGEFKNNMLNGIGTVLHSGNIYEGEFKDDYLYGNGKIVFKNGDVHEGEFIDDVLSGNGKIINKKYNYVVDGKFGKESDSCIMTFGDGDKFEVKTKVDFNAIIESKIIKLDNCKFETWNTQKVVIWISTFSTHICKRFSKIFYDNEIDGERLLLLVEKDGKEYGIDSLSMRQILNKRDNILEKASEHEIEYEIISK